MVVMYIIFQVATGLFDLVSSNSDLDHPLCEECTDALLDLMDTTLSRTQTQAQLCHQLFASLNDMPETDVSALENELENVSHGRCKCMSFIYPEKLDMRK